MLRIVRVETEDGGVVLVLEGHIVAEWVELLDRECSDVRRSDFRVALDLSGVTFVSRSGLEALRRLARAGVEVRGCSPLIGDMLAEDPRGERGGARGA